MTRRRLLFGIGGAGLIGVVAFAAAWATGLIFGGPSQSAWAAEVCEASATDPTQDATWQSVKDQFDEAILLLEESELPEGTEEFHAAVIAGMKMVRVQVNGFVRSDPGGGLVRLLDDLQRVSDTRPRGPSADAALSMFYTSIRGSESLTRTAARSLPERSRGAIEDVPGCAERLLG